MVMERARWIGAVAIGAVMLAACQTSQSAKSSPSPGQTPVAAASPSPSGATSIPLAVYDGPTLDRQGHVIYVVGIGAYGQPSCGAICDYAAKDTAKVLYTVQAGARNLLPAAQTGTLHPTAPADLPYISTSETRIYFLDGDSKVRAVAADGKVSDVASLPATNVVRAVFAVSPDDSKMAVALIDYSKQPIAETLYVANINGSNRTDIYSSTRAYYWPVGWHDGKVALATGSVLAGGAPPPNQYGATAYALIDPVPGATPASIGPGDCVPTGGLTPAGFACVKDPGAQCMGAQVGGSGANGFYTTCLARVDWSGKETTFLLTNPTPTNNLTVLHAALSTDGHVLLTDGLFWLAQPDAGGYPGMMGGFGGSGAFNTRPDQPGMGFIDGTHASILFIDTRTGAAYQRIYAVGEGPSTIQSVYFQGVPSDPYVPGGTVRGELMGTMPGGL